MFSMRGSGVVPVVLSELDDDDADDDSDPYEKNEQNDDHESPYFGPSQCSG